MKKYWGNYCGICIDTLDPEKRGRIKIFVPHVSMTLYDNWNSNKQDKMFKFPGLENPDLDKVIETCKDSLPWADCAAPIFGGSASGRYNANTRKGTTTDSNVWNGAELTDGARPIQNYKDKNKYPDAFTEVGKNNNRFINQHAYQYNAPDYSNLARGLFTIPNVGAHVWVFFFEGNPNFPVYFAVSHGQEDWKRIYSASQDETQDGSTDYPGSYENKTSAETPLNDDAKTFRSKHTFNSNKHTIELVDTDNREILRMTHFSGSFKEFNNYANIELATGNDQKMVIGSQFLTVQKNQSIYVAKSQELIVKDDQFTTIGNTDKITVQKIVDYLKQIHEYKMLFDIRRTSPDSTGKTPNVMSIYQTKSGNFAACPVCLGLGYTPNFDIIQGPNPYCPQLTLGDPSALLGDTSLMEPAEVERLTEELQLEIMGTNLPALMEKGTGVVAGAVCDTCKGSGLSPATQDGIWDPETLKGPGGAMENLLKSITPKITELERKLGEGDQIVNISKNKVETIGLIMNDMSSIRIDPIGKLRIDGMVVAPEQVYSTFKTSPHVEYVDVDDVPGGDYVLTCTNKYKLLVGAKGINIKTFGPVDIHGSLMNISGKQVNISSENEVFIDGGERFSIRARKISLHPFENAPVAIQGQLHVERNAIIGGGLMVEGEVGLLHVTAPLEYRSTEPFYGVENALVPLMTMPAVMPGVPGDGHQHIIPVHTHWYKHMAWSEMYSHEMTRDAMIDKGINSNEKLVAANPINGGIAEGEYGGLTYEQYEELVGRPSDEAARILPNVDAIGRVKGGLIMMTNGTTVTYTIPYWYMRTGIPTAIVNGITVTTTINIPVEGEPSRTRGPSAVVTRFTA